MFAVHITVKYARVCTELPIGFLKRQVHHRKSNTRSCSNSVIREMQIKTTREYSGKDRNKYSCLSLLEGRWLDTRTLKIRNSFN